MIIFNETDKHYNELIKCLKYSKNISTDFKVDLFKNNLDYRLKELIPSKYYIDDIIYYGLQSTYTKAWANLLREWTYINIRKDITTYIYWARVKYHPNYIKIGITYDISKRSEFENNKYYDYHVIRWCKNRYQAAYIEYKLRTLFCTRESEIAEINKMDDIIAYVRNFHYNKEMKYELKLLGWRFNNYVEQ